MIGQKAHGHESKYTKFCVNIRESFFFYYECGQTLEEAAQRCYGAFILIQDMTGHRTNLLCFEQGGWAVRSPGLFQSQLFFDVPHSSPECTLVLLCMPKIYLDFLTDFSPHQCEGIAITY